ncbi:MAG: hypothetical protein AAF620_15190 [Bacteroidota bacterium]
MKTNFNINSSGVLFLFQNENDILECEERRLLRMHDLRRASILGTVYNQESRIEYQDQCGNSCTVISKVSAITDKNVILQNEKLIPIHRISKVVV